MEFKEFNQKLQNHCKELFKESNVLFFTDVNKDELWETYLNSFPDGTNEIFRKRREHDCSCCKQFIRAFGNVVVISNNEIKSIWDFDSGSTTYQPVINALAKFVKDALIKDVFVTKEKAFGVEKNHEKDGDKIRTWHHFRIDLPKQFTYKGAKSEAFVMGDYRESKNAFKRSLEELSQDSIETVLDLISQKSLYKGEEWKDVLSKFLILHKEYQNVLNKENYCWLKSIEVGPVISRIKNHSIGVLLSDISSGMDLNEAVSRYEAIVAPTNYKRSKPIFTKQMLEKAKQKIQEMGFMPSLSRRHAKLDDITINNILFANRDVQAKMTGDVFDELNKEVSVKSKNFDKVEEVDVDIFVKDILPKADSIELLFENKHIPNLVSLVAPENKDSKNMFKWNNNFSWAYAGNITDSMKQRVKAAGGNVEGVLRFSIQWNEEGNNNNDFDAHCIEPNNNKICFSAMKSFRTGGWLDVDITNPGKKVAVENISYSNLDKMIPGQYTFMVHNYNHRGGRSGFQAEIEFDGQIHSFSYNKDINHNAYIKVVEVTLTKDKKFVIKPLLKSETAARTEWNIITGQFHSVEVCMFSPNYWDEQKGIGHKHYFFMLKDCKNDTSPNGFFNEFLNEDLREHRKVFEALGSKMKVKYSDQQLSGLGFSATKRNEVVCKVKGSFNRTIKVKF